MAQFWVVAESILIVFVIKFVNTALQTLSMNFLVKGRRLYTFIFAFLEVMVYLVGLYQVLNNMTIYKMLGYALGYATGALLGILL